jgi:outer membrane lipoprotein-sorting protein
MNIFARKPVLRWVAPLAFVAVIGGTTGIVATATAKDKLPDISAQDLLVRVQQAKVDTLSGTVVQNSDLGLPSVPGLTTSSGASLTSLLSGTHTLGVWYDGPDKSRIQVQGANDETDVIVNGKDVWQWSYKDNTATHRIMKAPAVPNKADKARPLPTDAPKTPQEAAAKALAALGTTTVVTTDGTATVAKINSYELVLTPKDDKSQVSQVKIAVDPNTYLPLRVQVFAEQPKPVFEVAYSSLSYDRPDAAQFDFKAPAGAKVKNVAPDSPATGKAPTKKQLQDHKAKQAEHADDTKVVGTGWSSVVVSKTGQAGSGSTNDQLQQVLAALPKVSGSWGSGHLFRGSAFSAVLTDDGRVALGSVKDPQLLYDALAK